MPVLLVIAVALSAKPVAKTWSGPLDSLDVREQAAGVLVKFSQADRATAETTITQVTTALGLAASANVAFVRTEAGPLAAIELMPPARGRFAKFGELARRLSEADAVVATWAFVAPGARDDSLEQEAWFRFEKGVAAGEARKLYRDDAVYLEHVRRKTSLTAFHRARWPSYPLSKLSAELALPGRACLDSVWQMHWASSTRWPLDAGENLTVATVELPGGMATEIQQAALKEKRSPSALVASVLAAAREAKALAQAPTHEHHASYDEGQSEDTRHARRSMSLYLPEAELDAAEDSGGAEAISLSRVVQYAWRRAHPIEPR